MTTPTASPHFHWLPTTRAGWWAVALFAAFFISVAVTVSFDVDLTVGRFNFVGAFNFLVAIAGGALAVFAVMRRGERALLIFAALLPGLFVPGFEGAELLFPPY